MSIAELSPDHKFKDPDVSYFSQSMVCSPVPRPHPLTRKNSLVNQVKFLGLTHAFLG